MSADLIEAREAIARRQNTAVNSLQSWANDYADVNFTTGANGQFAVNWNNPPGGNFVDGRGYQPAKDM